MNVAVDASKIPAPVFERSPGYWASVLKRFRRDPVAMAAALVVLALLLLAAGWTAWIVVHNWGGISV